MLSRVNDNAYRIDLPGECDEVVQGNEEDDPELQFKGPMTRLRAKKLQAYLQASIRRKFEMHEDEVKGSSRLITMLSFDDEEGSMKT